MPTYDRPAQVRACLAALARLDVPPDGFEVVVVDDGSPTPLDAVAGGFRSRLDLTLLRQANAGPAAARNAGTARARGALLAFTDDDCRPAPGWLRAMAAWIVSAPLYTGITTDTSGPLPLLPTVTAGCIKPSLFTTFLASIPGFGL